MVAVTPLVSDDETSADTAASQLCGRLGRRDSRHARRELRDELRELIGRRIVLELVACPGHEQDAVG